MLQLTIASTLQAVHPDRLAQIEYINAQPEITWTAAAHPRFQAQEPGQGANQMMGVLGDWKQHLEQMVADGTVTKFQHDPNAQVPDEFDSATNWPNCAKTIADIRDQSNCGSCWAFAGAEAASDRMCIATQGALMMPLSAQDLAFCSGIFSGSYGCSGGQIGTPWSEIKHSGAVTGGQFNATGPFGAGFCSDYSLPHCHHHGPQGTDPYPAEGAPGCPSASSPKCPKACDAAASPAHASWSDDKITFKGEIQSASGELAIQQMIMAGGPVSTAFSVYSDFENYAGGVYKHTTGEMMGGHAVKFVGWGVTSDGVKFWKVQNSWNPYWGEKGYFRIIRGDPIGNGGIESSVVGSAADATWGKKSDFERAEASAQ